MLLKTKKKLQQNFIRNSLYKIQSPALGLQLRPGEFQTAALYRLGVPIFQREGPCVACLFPHNDVYKYHAVLCAPQGGRISHHNHLRDAIYQAAVSATVGPKREESELLPGFCSKPQVL